jgi:hypothetical protein
MEETHDGKTSLITAGEGEGPGQAVREKFLSPWTLLLTTRLEEGYKDEDWYGLLSFHDLYNKEFVCNWTVQCLSPLT